MNEDGGGESIPQRHMVAHYHGDTMRIIFVVAAIVLLVAQSTGAELPMSTTGAVLFAVILVVAAGITNPGAKWIHWVNELLAVLGVILFGTSAVEHYRAGAGFFDPSFIYIEALALLSLCALYLTTKTIRGLLQQNRFQ